MAQKQYFSTKEILDEIEKNEIKGLFDAESTQEINKAISVAAEEIDAENRKREVQSIRDLGNIYITF
jgi:hypothetical protein